MDPFHNTIFILHIFLSLDVTLHVSLNWHAVDDSGKRVTRHAYASSASFLAFHLARRALNLQKFFPCLDRV